ncbi:MAG: hypothetical protein IJB41_09565, partial [Clostridia bacterium]|nr:hypothetical protein [Clostridia bacterium]
SGEEKGSPHPSEKKPFRIGLRLSFDSKQSFKRQWPILKTAKNEKFFPTQQVSLGRAREGAFFS